MNGRGRTSKIINLVDFDIEGKGYVVPQKLEPRVVKQVLDIAPGPGEEVIHAEQIAANFEQTFAQMRANETCTARHKYASWLRRYVRERRHRSGWRNGLIKADWKIHICHSENRVLQFPGDGTGASRRATLNLTTLRGATMLSFCVEMAS